MRGYRLTSKKNDDGFATPWLICFALLIIVIGAIFLEFGGALVQRQKLVTAADRAANAGATAIDEEELIDSEQVRLGTDAQNRCGAVLADEQANQANGVLDNGSCTIVDGGRAIEVKVKGTVTYGVIADWLGTPGQTFEVVSLARPTCSDVATPTGNCE